MVFFLPLILLSVLLPFTSLAIPWYRNFSNGRLMKIHSADIRLHGLFLRSARFSFPRNSSGRELTLIVQNLNRKLAISVLRTQPEYKRDALSIHLYLSKQLWWGIYITPPTLPPNPPHPPIKSNQIAPFIQDRLKLMFLTFKVATDREVSKNYHRKWEIDEIFATMGQARC